MRTLPLLLCATLLGLAAAQFGKFRGFNNFRGQRRPQQNFFQPQQNFQRQPPQNFQRQPPQNFQPRPQQQPQQQSGGLYYSWLDNPKGKFTWQQANDACISRGQRLVSLDSPGKNQDIVNRIARDNVKYIWTGGKRERNTDFVWPNDNAVGGFGWSRTGGNNKPQPDNREGNEFCLAILNKFYPGDGITWHDVSCHHKKPYVCE